MPSLRPVVVAARRRSRTRLRALKRGAGRSATALLRAIQGLVRTIHARVAAFAAAQQTAARIVALQKQVAAAEEQAIAHQHRERRLASSLLSAEQVVLEITEAARAHAQETIEAAQVAADEIIQAARVTADGQLAAARAAADEAFRGARAHAEEELNGVAREAAAQMDEVHAAADRLMADTRRMILELKRSAEAQTAAFAEKVAEFEAEREQYAHGLQSLIKRHVDTLETVTHMHAGVQQELLPALRRLMAGLKGVDAGWLRGPGNKNGGGRDRSPTGPPEPPPPVLSPLAADAPRPTGLACREGVISVRHVNSFKEATRFVNALARVPGMQAVRLRSYTNGMATVEVTVERQTLAGLDLSTLDGFAVNVVESSDTQLVLQFVRTPQRSA